MPITEGKAGRLRLILTAGYNNAPQAVALCQLLVRDGHQIAAILVVNPLELRRVWTVFRHGGIAALKSAARRLFGHKRRGTQRAAGPLEDFFAAEHLHVTNLKIWARANGVAYHLVDSLSGATALDAIRESASNGVLFCGGGILRQPFLNATNGQVLNAHLGPLPWIRGMNAVEWTLLLGLTPTVTVHFIDAGVDTGPVVATAPFGWSPGDTTAIVRERSIVAAIQALRSNVDALAEPSPPQSPERERQHGQYFTLAAPLRALLDDRLEHGSVQC
jgi:hypothetical protein